jgi:cytochrome-b5 reductase
MLCGPPGMVNAAKGMLGEMGFKLPGAAAKMDDEIFVF